MFCKKCFFRIYCQKFWHSWHSLTFTILWCYKHVMQSQWRHVADFASDGCLSKGWEKYTELKVSLDEVWPSRRYFLCLKRSTSFNENVMVGSEDCQQAPSISFAFSTETLLPSSWLRNTIYPLYGNPPEYQRKVNGCYFLLQTELKLCKVGMSIFLMYYTWPFTWKHTEPSIFKWSPICN